MTSLTLVDTEGTVRDWARAETNISGAVGTRIFLSTPLSYPKAPNTSWIVMTLVAESPQSGDFSLQKALIQFDCYGTTKALAATASLAVQTAARLLSYGQPVTITANNAVISWADVSQKRWLPDPTINKPRYIVDVLFAIHGVEA